jgi:hypothetical protein
MAEKKRSELEIAKEGLEKHGITVTIDDSQDWDIIFPGSKGSQFLDSFIKPTGKEHRQGPDSKKRHRSSMPDEKP